MVPVPRVCSISEGVLPVTNPTFEPQEGLELWLPETGHQNSLETHGAFWDERMQGGMDEIISPNLPG